MITPSSLPLDSFKQGSEAITFHAVDHFDESDAAFQVRAEVRKRGAILRFGTVANAVGQDGFQQFEFTPAKIGLLVHNNSG